MKATFIELPAFERYRSDYLSDDGYRELQQMLLENPEAGARIQGTGGLRKIRFKDENRQKGKRGGIRVIYYWQNDLKHFWLFTIYNKDEMDDLTPKQRQTLSDLLSETLKKGC